MRFQKSTWFSIGALVAVAVGALAQSGGGFPSRPRFASVGVGIAAPSGTGNMQASGLVSGASLNIGGTALTANASGTVATLPISMANTSSMGGNPLVNEITGTATLTYVSGCTSATPNLPITYTLNGNVVTVRVTASATCAQTAENMVWSGLPLAIQTANAPTFPVIINQGTLVAVEGIISSTSNFQLFPTATGSIGIQANSSFSYPLF
jgi:hypothetical protein